MPKHHQHHRVCGRKCKQQQWHRMGFLPPQHLDHGLQHLEAPEHPRHYEAPRETGAASDALKASRCGTCAPDRVDRRHQSKEVEQARQPEHPCKPHQLEDVRPPDHQVQQEGRATEAEQATAAANNVPAKTLKLPPALRVGSPDLRQPPGIANRIRVLTALHASGRRLCKACKCPG
eukprot:CAMPEP_0175332246 /NCGR_PEP_ID=MMETSP0095-20121207/1667_1 /TAXON_ID=311494 /ORGANISM="Alexandrium monilatum, Strain CCMP3105" /LENGTH=175 /DNA_ID=CAMNT_0016629505 /DNA_START=42 /DNA_END=565 /DNA_ORIENTATION=+